MKNIKKIFLIIGLFFVITLSVNAKDEVFKYDWSKGLKSELSYRDVPYNTTIEFKDGYVNSDVYFYDGPNTRIQRYSFKGETLATTTLKYTVVYSMLGIDSNIYVIAYDMEKDLFALFKFDDKLNKIDELELPSELRDNILNINYILKIYGINYISVYEDEIVFVDPMDSKIYITDKNFEDTQTKNLSENLIKKYYPDVYYGETLLNDLMDDYSKYISIDFNDKKLVTGGVKSSCEINATSAFIDNSRTASCDTKGVLLLTDDKGNKIWFKELEEYNIIANARFVNGYIVAVGYSLLEVPRLRDAYPEFKSDILIFDMDGNLVQKIEGEDDTRYLLIEPSKAGFTINKTSGYCRDIDLNPIMPHGESPYDCEMKLEAYYLPRKIKTKVNGEGTINVVDNARYGDEIIFEAIPKEGYVIDSIKITDSNGEVVSYSNNKFTMSASDVLIEAVFLPKNPETNDMAIISVFLITALMFGVMLINYKKVKFLS